MGINNDTPQRMAGLHPLAHQKRHPTYSSVCGMKTQRDYWQESHDQIMEEMKFRNDSQPNTITCMAAGEDMLRVSPDGFWVRGVKVAQDDREAEIVYNAFKAWMTWAQLSKDYK